jgi:hypothetical protein
MAPKLVPPSKAPETYTVIRTVYSLQLGTRVQIHSDKPWPLPFRVLFRLLGFSFVTWPERVQIPNDQAYPEA